jgi:flavodoxin I
VADLIKDALGDAALEPVDIGDVDDLSATLTDSSLDGLIVGAPTWNTGADEGRSGTAWDDVVSKIQGLDLKGRKVAVFGCGDQHGYGDYFCDAMEELYSSFAAAGADMVGQWPTDGYEHSESKAEVEPGLFCGLALDQDNQDDLTESRIAKWTSQVVQAMNVKVAA